MRIGSLFSGAGGLDMAVEEVFGGEVIWQAEVDKAASKVLAYRFPCAPNLGDITAIDWKTVETPDVLCGGFPCQDVSAAGKRAGIKDGTRSGLWSVFADAIDQLRPPFVVIENVRGLLSATAHREMESEDSVVGDGSDRPVLRALGAVLGDLADLGYDAQWATVAASSVGAPHRRERVFIVGTLSHPGHHAGRTEQRVEHETQTGWAGQPGHRIATDKEGVALLPTPSACNPNDGEGTETWLARREAVKARVKNGNGMGMPLSIAVQLLPTPQAFDRVDHIRSPEKVADTDGGCRNLREVVVNELPAESALLPTPNASDGDRGPQHPDRRVNAEGLRHARKLPDYALLNVEPERWGKYEPAIRRWEQINGPAPAPTEPNKNGNPRLAAAFSEWMMGWPAGWVTDPDIGISRNDQLRIVGNGVCPQQAVAALRFLLAVANGTHTHTPRRADVNELLPTPRATDPGGAHSRAGQGFRPQLGEIVRTLA